MSKTQTTMGARLALGLLAMTGIIGYSAYLGAANSWQYYVVVDEIVSDSSRFLGKRVRVSGRVADDSLITSDDRREAAFELRGSEHAIHVSCQCVVPDNFEEGVDVVVEGLLQADGIHGHKIITRCASKYEPKSVESLQRNTLDDDVSSQRVASRSTSD